MEFNKLVSTKDIGLLIKTTRKAQGVTQEQLAGVANTGIRFISDLENGKPTIQVNKLLNVLSALGLGMYIFSKRDLNKWRII